MQMTNLPDLMLGMQDHIYEAVKARWADDNRCRLFDVDYGFYELELMLEIDLCRMVKRRLADDDA